MGMIFLLFLSGLSLPVCVCCGPIGLSKPVLSLVGNFLLKPELSLAGCISASDKTFPSRMLFAWLYVCSTGDLTPNLLYSDLRV